jgi:hypothetical protein
VSGALSFLVLSSRAQSSGATGTIGVAGAAGLALIGAGGASGTSAELAAGGAAAAGAGAAGLAAGSADAMLGRGRGIGVRSGWAGPAVTDPVVVGAFAIRWLGALRGGCVGAAIGPVGGALSYR